MTFCLGIKVKEGLIGIADTRVTSGTERITARKVSIHQHGQHSLFLMTSGLRSVRDKAVTYFSEVLEQGTESYDKLYKICNAFSTQVRRVAAEDKQALTEAGLNFNLFSLVGGQLEADREPRLYMIYPQGNWVEVGAGSPYYIIGESGYGKPILDRTLTYDSPLPLALQVGFLAFNATITCATDVDYPLDMVAYRNDTYKIVEARYKRNDLTPVADRWQEMLRDAVGKLPGDWRDNLLQKLPP